MRISLLLQLGTILHDKCDRQFSHSKYSESRTAQNTLLVFVRKILLCLIVEKSYADICDEIREILCKTDVPRDIARLTTLFCDACNARVMLVIAYSKL